MSLKDGNRGSIRPLVRPSMCPSALLNINISETSGSIPIKSYLKCHWGGGNAALGFGADQFRTLVSMATDSSHRAIMGKTVLPLFLGCLPLDPLHICR